MKPVLILAFIVLATKAQTQDSFKLNSTQVREMAEIDTSYLRDMFGIRERAETGYNEPKHIHYQHKYTIMGRLKALRKILTPEQYQHIIQTRYDISPDREWLAAFYKKNKLMPIEQVVKKLEEQSASH